MACKIKAARYFSSLNRVFYPDKIKDQFCSGFSIIILNCSHEGLQRAYIQIKVRTQKQYKIVKEHSVLEKL